MKKAIIVIIPILVIVGLILKAGRGSRSTGSSSALVTNENVPSPETILKKDLEKIAVHLDPILLESAEWGKINDYAILPGKFVTKDNAKAYFESAKSSIPKIFSCLQKDFCGMQTRGEDDAYFDDERTPAHILLNRNLRVMLESLRNNPELKNEVDWNLLEEVMATNNQLLTPEALEIIREFNGEGVKIDDLIKLARDSKGDARANSLLNLSKTKDLTSKTLLGSEVQNIFSFEDSNTVITVLEKLKKMNLPSAQLPGILRNLCKFKEEESHNWPMIRFEAVKVFSQFESLCN